MKLGPKDIKVFKARYTPEKGKEIFAYLEPCIGKIYLFTRARSVGEVKKYWPADINFLSSAPVPATDLEFIED